MPVIVGGHDYDKDDKDDDADYDVDNDDDDDDNEIASCSYYITLIILDKLIFSLFHRKCHLLLPV